MMMDMSIPSFLSPSVAVDELWHTFMLMPEDYFHFCFRAVSGADHPWIIPHSVMSLCDSVHDRKCRYDRTLLLYKLFFGTPAPSDIWPTDRFDPGLVVSSVSSVSSSSASLVSSVSSVSSVSFATSAHTKASRPWYQNLKLPSAFPPLPPASDGTKQFNGQTSSEQTSEPPAKRQKPSTDGRSNFIKITFGRADQRTVLDVEKSTKISDVFEKYCFIHGLDIRVLQFYNNGVNMYGFVRHQISEVLDDGDVVEVVHKQTGC